MFAVATIVTLVFITVISTIFGATIPSLPLAILASIAVLVGAIWVFGNQTEKRLTDEEDKTLDKIFNEVNER